MSQEFIGGGHWLDIKKRPSRNNIARIVNGNGVIMEMNTFSGDVTICRGDEQIQTHYEQLSKTLNRLGISQYGWQSPLQLVGKESRIDPSNLPWSDTAADELYEETDRERKASLDREKKGK